MEEVVKEEGLSEQTSEDRDWTSHADIWVRSFQAEGRANPSPPHTKSDRSD